MLRICLVSDIHHGTNPHSGVFNNAVCHIRKFNEFCEQHEPNIVIDLGDRINDKNHAKDFEMASEVASEFAKNKYKTFHINGNHDIENLSFESNQNIYKQSKDSELIELAGVRVAIWRAEAKLEISSKFRGIHIRDSDLEWLKKICTASKDPLLIFSHIPLSGRSHIGNAFFENNEELSKYSRNNEIRSILRHSQSPTFCFAGHVHQNSFYQVDGISHFTQQSLTETYVTKNQLSNSMGLIEVDQTLTWNVFGSERIKIEEPLEKKNWITPIEQILPKF